MKFGEIDRAEMTGGGEGSRALSQWLPLSGERKIPPFNRQNTGVIFQVGRNCHGQG
jgi:hypothetical protein